VTLFGGLGYHPPYPANLGDAAGLLVTDEARLLREADLYIIAPEMCDVVLAAAATLTVPDLRLLTKEDLPSQTGAVMLPYPVLTRTISGELSDLRAFAWRTPAAIAYPDPRCPHPAPTVVLRRWPLLPPRLRFSRGCGGAAAGIRGYGPPRRRRAPRGGPRRGRGRR